MGYEGNGCSVNTSNNNRDNGTHVCRPIGVQRNHSDSGTQVCVGCAHQSQPGDELSRRADPNRKFGSEAIESNVNLMR